MARLVGNSFRLNLFKSKFVREGLLLNTHYFPNIGIDIQ